MCELFWAKLREYARESDNDDTTGFIRIFDDAEVDLRSPGNKQLHYIERSTRARSRSNLARPYI
jgi:hypothetical protein